MAWFTTATSANRIRTRSYHFEFKYGGLNRRRRTVQTVTDMFVGIDVNVQEAVVSALSADATATSVSSEDIGGGGRNITQVTETFTSWIPAPETGP